MEFGSSENGVFGSLAILAVIRCRPMSFASPAFAGFALVGTSIVNVEKQEPDWIVRFLN